MENVLEQTSRLNTILFNNDVDLINEESKKLPAWINVKHPLVPEAFRSYEYPVSSWPVLIDSTLASELERLSTRIPELLRKIPELYFNNDVVRIADYYFDGNEMMAQFAMLCHNKNTKVAGRLDLILSEDGLKILEVNVGSSIGGFQVQNFERLIQDLHPALNERNEGAVYNSRNIQQYFIDFLVDQVLACVPDIEDEINIFVSLDHIEDPKLKADSLVFFNELLKNELNKKDFFGRAFSGDTQNMTLTKDGLQFDGERIHSVLILNMDATIVPPIVTRAFIMNKIYFPDHLATDMYGDKRNLAFLRELAEQNKFDADDNALILKSIPWTHFVEDKKVIFNENEHSFYTLLKEQKALFVVKAANGFAGKDVFVGKFINDQKWSEALELAKTNKEFIAQEYCDSQDFLAPDCENQWSPHKLIWGSFGFGDNYGGVWVRMSAVKTDIGVINSATGAVEAIVYEKRRVSTK